MFVTGFNHFNFFNLKGRKFFYNDSLNTNQMTAAHNIVMKLQNINFITALIKLIKTY